MNLIESYDHRLRFHIDLKTNHIDVIKKWFKLKKKCESGNNKQRMIEHIKSFCKLEQNQKRVNLDYGVERYMDNRDSHMSKQFIFRNNETNNDYDIVIIMCNSSEGMEKWTYEELDDLICAFIETGEFYVQYNGCIMGCIEMTNG